MKVIRVPLRVSLFGGGTDLPSYYEKHGSTIISFAITRYMYLIWNPRPTGGCRLSYSEVEELETLKDAKHTLVRAAAKKYGFEEPCTLTIISDVPKGTGLGSSSALAVALLWLARVSGSQTRNALALERSVSPNVGIQDFLPAVYGGFNIYEIVLDKIHVDGYAIIDLPMRTSIINEYGLLLYTGINREASKILADWDKSKRLQSIHELANCMADRYPIWTPESLGNALNETWALKASIPGVATDELHLQHVKALNAGALGGKLCGAGGGGCWFFLVPPERRQAVIDELGLVEIPFQVAEKGVEEWMI